MARGGARPGAGRKQGAATRKTRDVADKAMKQGKSPLEFVLARMLDPEAPMDDRMEAAKAALPFCHPRLSSIEAKLDGDLRATVRKIERTIVDPVTPDA